MIFISEGCDVYHLFDNHRLIDRVIIINPTQFIAIITKVCCRLVKEFK
jgi:hypothetical protein